MTCTAFEGTQKIASGAIQDVSVAVKQVLDRGERSPVLIFDDATSELVEIDFRGSVAEVAARLGSGEQAQAARGPGRPKLGVVAREVTLLPRHWDWLNSQPGGASVALRKLVEEARKANSAKDRRREAQNAAYRFLTAMAGNEAGFEEALRALFAGDQSRFEHLSEPWPVDVRDHGRRLSAAAFAK